MMPTRKSSQPEIGKRIHELKEEGKDWKTIYPIIRKETGKDLAESTIRALETKWKQSLRDEHAERSSHKTSLPAERAEEKAFTKRLQAMPEDWKTEMESIAKRVMENMLNAHNVHTIKREDEEIPPEPTTVKGEGKGRKENRDYERITVAIDTELAALFKQEMSDKGLSSGKLLDRILWNRYGKPKLSYQDE